MDATLSTSPRIRPQGDVVSQRTSPLAGVLVSPGADGEDEEPERPSVEELVRLGGEIRVPTDTSLEHAIETVNSLGDSQPCYIAIEPGEYHAECMLEINVPGVTIRGLSHIDRLTGAATRATVYGVWRLTFRSGGRLCDLDLVNKSWDAALVSVLDGNWEIANCSLSCGIDPLKKKPYDGYRSCLLLYAPICCLGGSLLVRKSHLGGFGIQVPAYGGIICSKESVCQAEECTISFCQKFAVCLRDSSKLTLVGCQLVRNDAVFSAGFPNMATLVMEKNKIFHNHKMWTHAPPKTIEDKLDNIDITGYLIQIYPDI